MTNFLDRCKILSGSMLKVIALVAMVIDHLAYTLVDYFPILEDPLFCIGSTEITLFFIMRRIGRLAFPIFAFLTVEGYFHTGNLRKYVGRLLLFAILSEIPFNLAMGSRIFYPVHQNVLWSFLISIGLIHLNETVKRKKSIWKSVLAGLITVLLGYISGLVTMVDFYHAGVLTVLVFYFFRQKKWWSRGIPVS